MNKEKRIGRLMGFTVLAFILIQGIFSGCKKDGPTMAVITVVDSLGRPAQGATVELWQDTAYSSQTGAQASVRQTKQTDAAGKAEFEFSLEAFLNLWAYKYNDTIKSFIRLEEHETVYRTVTL